MLPAWFAPHTSLRVMFHRWRGVQIGKKVEIGYFVLIDNVYPNLVTIEDGAVVTAMSTILSHDNARYYTVGGNVKLGRTTIGKNAFIGIGAVVLPTVTVGEYSIVGPNSVVTKDIPPNRVYAGVPAKEISTNNESKNE